MDNHKKNPEINIIKGIAIIMMVYGHTFGLAREWVYLFHMPVFFMVSGYCWNSLHAASGAAAREYYFNRAKRLMLPYFLCRFLITLLNNVLVSLRFYTDDSAFLELVGTTPITQRTVQILSPFSILINCYRVMFFQYSPPQLTGPVWFLYALFIVCVSHCGLVYLTGKIRRRSVRIGAWIIIVLICAIIAACFSKGYGDEAFDIRHRRLFASYLCYLTGIVVRKLSGKWKANAENIKKQRMLEKNKSLIHFQFIFFFMVLCILGRFGRIELSDAYITNPFFLILCLVCGWIMLESLAKILKENAVGKCLSYIGMHTMSIVLLHLFAFKLVSFIIVFSSSLPLYMVASYPIMFQVPEAVKLVYTAAGTILPILVYRAVEKGKEVLPLWKMKK